MSTVEQYIFENSAIIRRHPDMFSFLEHSLQVNASLLGVEIMGMKFRINSKIIHIRKFSENEFEN